MNITTAYPLLLCGELLTKRNNIFFILLVLSGFLGYYTAIVNHSAWLISVESGQVLAGIVEYPKSNIFYAFLLKKYSLLSQMSAILLYFGISEKTVSIISCGILGSISFQALTLVVFAFSRNVVLAVLAPLFIYFMNYIGYGVAYPIMLMSTKAGPYGTIGLSFILLVIALIGNGQHKLGGLFLGIAPAVHPSLGAFCVLIVGITFLWDYKNSQKDLKKLFKYFFIGCFITAVSLTYQFYFLRELPTVDLDKSKDYFSSYIRYWDYHRQPVKLWSYGILTCVANLLASILALRCLKEELPSHSLFILRLFIVSSLLSILLATITLLPPEIVPNILITLMPGRFQNLNNLSFVVLLIGILGNSKSKNLLLNKLILFIFVSCSLLLMVSAYYFDLPRYSKLFNQSKLLLPFIAFIFLVFSTLFSDKINRFFNAWTDHFSIPAYKMTLILFFLMGVTTLSSFGFTVLSKYNGWIPHEEIFSDWSNDPLYAEIYRKKGLLLTASNITAIQLYTRRPVLLDGGDLDGFAYAPEAGPGLNNILKRVYGLNLFVPLPQQYRNRGTIPDIHKELWESRSLEQWREIKNQFGVFDILTYLNWNLNLPIVIQNEKYILYHIDD